MMHPSEPDVLPQGTLWMLDLGQPLPVGPVPQVPVTFMRAGPEVAQELAQAMNLDDQAMVAQRFDNGRHCYLGRIEDRLATYGWVTFDEEDIGELGLSIRLKAGEAYIWNCATLPAYRGQRLYPALLVYIVGELYHQGLRRVWIGTDTDNLPSQSGFALAGFQPIGDIVINHGLTMSRAWMRGRPGVSERLVMDARQALLGGREEVWLAANSEGVNLMPKQDSEKTKHGAGPLDGLLIADFSRVLAGPYCTMLLGDLGATVIKVESPAGDDTRTWMPPDRNGVATYYMAINRNKRSVVLDFNDPADLRLAQELAARADVFIENFKPGGLKRFGLDYDTVQQRNAGIIYASISGFGTAQGASLPGYDLIVQAMSGLMSLTGDPDGPAYRSGISVFDVMAGLHTTIGILAALNHRNHTGEGQQVEVSLYATALSGMVNQTTAYVAGGVVPQRMGNAHPSLFPYEALPTADLDLIIAAGNNGQFSKLCEVLDLPELPHDPRFANTKDRTRNREALRPLLVERLRTRTAHEWFRRLSAVGVPCGPINSVEGGIAFAREIGLDPVVEVGTGEDAVPMIRHPISFSLTPPRHDLPPPALGQDNEQIRAWLSHAERTGAEELNTDRPSSEQG